MSWVDQFILGGLLIAIIKCLRKILHELMMIKLYTQSIMINLRIGEEEEKKEE